MLFRSHRSRLGPERVRVAPGRAAVLELVADEPPVVKSLQVVSRGRFAVTRRTTGEEVGPSMQHRRPGGADSSRGVHNDRDGREG